MGKSVIDVYSSKTAKWFAEGKSLNNIKELLQLPESFQVDRIEPIKDNNLRVFVSSPDIPEIREHNGLHATIQDAYAYDEEGHMLKGKDGNAVVEGFQVNPYGFVIKYAEPNTALEV